MNRSLAFIALVSLAMAGGAAGAAPCKDAKGKFTKCPPAASAAKSTAANVTKDKNGKCHFASGPKKGQFTKCA